MKKEDIIVVDLDGTLIYTDILAESLLLLSKKNPLLLFLVVWWFLKYGLSVMKVKIADRVQPDVTLLPYNTELLAFLKHKQSEGTDLWLASASDSRVVEKVANHCKLFSLFFGTTTHINVKGANKLQLITDKAAGKTFSYIGNEFADIPILNAGVNAYIVSANKSLSKHITKNSDSIVFFLKPRRILSIVKALRVHQWSKNILIFIPLFLAHKITDSIQLFSCINAFISFSFCASAVYIINDLIDLEADRKHTKKKMRPFACGNLSIVHGIGLIFCSFFVSGLFIAKTSNPNFTLLIVIYVLITFFYSLIFKKTLLFDVLLLSGLYTIRIFAGGIASSTEVTTWFLAFSSFFFLSLAFVKRFVELKEQTREACGKLTSRNYETTDISLVQSAGITSGFMSILIFLLYITTSKQVTVLYNNPQILWFLPPVMIYWILRMWFLAQRGLVDSDPVLFAIKDKVSWIVGIVIVTAVILGSSMQKLF